MNNELNIMLRKLPTVFAHDTCYHGDADKWSKDNPTAGHCAVSALLIQERLGGEIRKTKVNRHSHYFNVLEDNTLIDVTAEQFKPIEPKYDKYEVANRNSMLKNKDTNERYTKLRERYLSIV